MQESLGTNDRKLAEKIYAKTLTDIIEGRYFDSVKAKNTFFEEMVEKYLEEHAHSRDEHTVKRLVAFFKGYTLFEINTRFVAEYRNLRSKKVKPATIYQELALLRRMFNVAIREWEWIKDNPVSETFLLCWQQKRSRSLVNPRRRRKTPRSCDEPPVVENTPHGGASHWYAAG